MTGCQAAAAVQCVVGAGQCAANVFRNSSLFTHCRFVIGTGLAVKIASKVSAARNQSGRSRASAPGAPLEAAETVSCINYDGSIAPMPAVPPASRPPALHTTPQAWR